MDRIKAQEPYHQAEQQSYMFSAGKNAEGELELEPNTNSKVLGYETQYDANHDFAIFGCGDATQGGVQTLAQKMNLADNVEEEDKTTHSKSGTAGSSSASPDLPENKELEEL